MSLSGGPEPEMPVPSVARQSDGISHGVSASRVIAMSMTEARLQALVVDAALKLRWLVHHCRPAQNRNGRWSTPIQGSPGFCDLVLVHARMSEVVYAELKREGGKTTPEQDEWLHCLRAAGQRAYVWFPSDWVSGRIQAVLEGVR